MDLSYNVDNHPLSLSRCELQMNRTDTEAMLVEDVLVLNTSK